MSGVLALTPVPRRLTWGGPTTGLAHRWPLADANVAGSVATDVVAGLNGTLAGASSAAGPGSGNTARAFSGSNSYMSLASCPIDFSKPHSVFLWAYLNSIVGTQCLYNFYGDANNQVACQVRSSGELWLTFTAAGVSSSSGTPNGFTFPATTWVSYGYVWNGSTMAMYVNGVAQTVGYVIAAGQNTNLLGAVLSGAQNIAGREYQAVIYNNKALSPSEVSALYAAY